MPGNPLRLIARANGFAGKTISESISLAAEIGFDGIDLPAGFDPTTHALSNALMTDPELIRAAAKIRVSCVSTALNGNRNEAEIRAVIALAKQLNCPSVRLHDRGPIDPRYLSKLADVSDRMLLLDLPGNPADIWHLFDRIDHPAVRYVLHAETSAVAISTLNLRIGAVVLDPFHATAKHAVDRLRGIGFDGDYFLDPPTFEAVQTARKL